MRIPTAIVERQRCQSAAHLERMLVITAPLAVRLLQLREILGRSDEQAGCDTLLSEDEWQVLWITTQRSKPPATLPSIHWVCQAVAQPSGEEAPNQLVSEGGQFSYNSRVFFGI